MAKLVLAFFFLAWPALAKIEFINTIELSHKEKFKGTQIGGLSGLYYDNNTKSIFAACDDRGRINEPRFYEFNIELKENKFSIKPKEVYFFIPREGKPFWKILDIEGIAKLPWGSFVFSSEGDLNQIPRQQLQLLDAKADGKLVRQWDVPKKFLRESTGQPTKGIRNNNGWEGLSVSADGKIILAATEAALLQDADEPFTTVRFVQYESPEAWLIKPSKEYAYRVDERMAKNKEIEVGFGVSEVLFDVDNSLLVMERTLLAQPTGIGFKVRIYKTVIKDADDVSKVESFKKTMPKSLKKELFLDLDDFKTQLGGKIYNFEGMTWGPDLPDGGRSLILVADDNFNKNQKTQFVFLKVK